MLKIISQQFMYMRHFLCERCNRGLICLHCVLDVYLDLAVIDRDSFLTIAVGGGNTFFAVNFLLLGSYLFGKIIHVSSQLFNHLPRLLQFLLYLWGYLWLIFVVLQVWRECFLDAFCNIFCSGKVHIADNQISRNTQQCWLCCHQLRHCFYGFFAFGLIAWP